MKSFLGRFRYNRLASTFTILATLSAAILIGSAVAHQVRGQESKVNSSDATPLKVPAPHVLSTDFTKIAKEVGPAVVNINTEILPKQQNRRRGPHYMQPWSSPQQQPPDDGNGDDDDQGPQGGDQDQGRRARVPRAVARDRARAASRTSSIVSSAWAPIRAAPMKRPGARIPRLRLHRRSPRLHCHQQPRRRKSRPHLRQAGQRSRRQSGPSR